MKKRRIVSFALALVLLLALTVPAAAGADDTLTRGAFVAGLCEACGGAGAEAETVFSDVPAGSALALAVRWASDNGIVKGYGDGRFGPDDAVTREQMVTMLYRCAEALGQSPAGEWMFPLGYADAAEISDYADKAMQWAVMNRIIVGTDRGIEPQKTATEGQLSLVLERWETFARAGEAGSRGVLILYTSDIHCGIQEGFGYAGLWEVRNALEKQGYDVLLVDDGDNIQGEPVGTLTKGATPAELMNRMGYDAAIPGNHEFDYGVETFLELAEKAEFPYLSCNFNYKGELLFEPYTVLEAGGRKIAFVGVTTPETLTSSTPVYFKDESGEFVYRFLEDGTGEGVYRAVQSAVDSARAEGADYVILLGHLGNYAGSAPWNYGDVISHTSGIDALLDGHSHDTDQVTVRNAVGKSVVRSACGTKLCAIGWCSIAPDGTVSAGLYPWNVGTSAPELLGIDNEMSRAVASGMESLNEVLGTVVAHSDVDLTINDPVAVQADGRPVRMIRRGETNLGDLCADACRAQSGADIAFVNGGGIRVDIEAGDITMSDILNVHPFGNNLSMIEATGRQILDALEWGAREVPGETGGFLQVSGLTYEICTYVESSCVRDENGLFLRIDGARRVRNVLVDGVPIDPEKTYTLAAYDYMLQDNGDGYTMFDGAPLLLDRVKLDNQVLIDFITGTLGGQIGAEYADPCGQGRITVVTAEEETAD